MGTESKNREEQRRELNGVTYFDRGRLTGRDGTQYDRYAIQTHFIEVGEDQAELVRRYAGPLYQQGDVLAFGAKVMAMCTRNVRTKEQVHTHQFLRQHTVALIHQSVLLVLLWSFIPPKKIDL